VEWRGLRSPVLHYRSLLHSVPADPLLEMGDSDQSFRYSNYLSRSMAHMDLMTFYRASRAAAAPASRTSGCCWVFREN